MAHYFGQASLLWLLVSLRDFHFNGIERFKVVFVKEMKDYFRLLEL